MSVPCVNPLVERSVDELLRLEADAVAGDTSSASTYMMIVNELAGRVSRWQWVIHGDTREYRQEVCRVLCRRGEFKAARRMALCGRGDEGRVEIGGEAVRVRPKGCGCRCCPRCSRRVGRRFVQRVCGHLAAEPHGEVWHFVLTQSVHAGESLDVTRERMNRRWKRFYPKLREIGLVGALATWHVKPAISGGWHYHCHLLVEWARGGDSETRHLSLSDAWSWAADDQEFVLKSVWGRCVVGEGEAIEGLATETQMEFWSERGTAVENAVRYVVRDVLQGVESWVQGITLTGQVEQFVSAVREAKLHRLYGKWRSKLPEKPSDEEAEKPEMKIEAASTGQKVFTTVGTMDHVLWGASRGFSDCQEAWRRLLQASTNRGVVASRLRSLATALQI